MTCPNADILNRFADATLSDHEAVEVVAHLAVCEACSRKVDELEHRPEQSMMAALRDLQNVPPVINVDPPLPKTIGQYEILEKIGSGGMGTVYRAMHPHLKREVALKVIRDSRLDDPNARERFVQEMQSLGKLTHPNIVHATDAGIDGDTPFIVTELLDGQDLASYIEEHGKMQVKLAVDYIRQAATGLTYAHKAGYIHRDIKPSNLFLARDGSVKILDLGIARPLADSAGEGQTVTGHVVGSPKFMAPEQLRGSTVDARSDIYSLGQTFLYILTGKDDDVSGVPSRLKKVLVRMMAGAPSQRFQTADELLKAVDTLTTHERFKKNIVLATAGTILMIVAFIALRGSTSDAESVVETPLVVKPRNAPQERVQNEEAEAALALKLLMMAAQQENSTPTDSKNRSDANGTHSGRTPREFNLRTQPMRTVNENLGLDPYGRPLNKNASNQYRSADPPQPAAPRNCVMCGGTGRETFACTFCKGTGMNGSGPHASMCSYCKGMRFPPCKRCKGTGKQ